MILVKRLLAISILISFIGCGHKNHIQKNEIKRVVFASGGCYGTCPIQVIDIDSTLAFKYLGVEYTNKIGFYTGSVTNGFWDTLNLKLESVNFKQLDTAYQHSVDDLSTEILIYYGDKVKHIYGQSSSLPDSVMAVYDWLLYSMERFELKSTRDSFSFPTKIHTPLPIPPMPERFIPPIADEK